MKILWVKSDFLHPTTKGGQIRTLEMLRRLHRDHEIHYVAFDDGNPEGPERSSEYSTRAYPIPFRPRDKRSPAFAIDLAQGLVSPVPVAVGRYRSRAMRDMVARLRREHSFDALVCDFLVPSINIPDIEAFTVFQHNVETAIWKRHVKQAPDPLRRAYFGLQARRMESYERDVCNRAAQVIAVSDVDAREFERSFGARSVAAVDTGVDVDFFRGPGGVAPVADLVFVGSMDWMPNIHGITEFLDDILPLIRKRQPDCKVAIVGRKPPPELAARTETDPNLIVTGTVPDVRPYLWGSLVSIVPLYIGGGTRLKIYEAMASGTPVVSTSIGAEGLAVASPTNIRICDDPESFASACLELLEDSAERHRMAEAASTLVARRFSWDRVAEQFAGILTGLAARA